MLIETNHDFKTSPIAERNCELQLEDGVFLFESLPGSAEKIPLLYAPAYDFMRVLKPTEALVLKKNYNKPKSIKLLLDGILGKDRSEHKKEIVQNNEYKPLSVALMLTTTCQLRCSYCYAEAGSTPIKYLECIYRPRLPRYSGAIFPPVPGLLMVMQRA